MRFYEILHQLLPAQCRKTPVLQFLRTQLQPEAMSPASRESQSCAGLFAMRLARAKHASTKELAPQATANRAVWRRAGCTSAGPAHALACGLRPGTRQRSRRLAPTDAGRCSLGISLGRLDEA